MKVFEHAAVCKGMNILHYITLSVTPTYLAVCCVHRNAKYIHIKNKVDSKEITVSLDFFLFYKWFFILLQICYMQFDWKPPLSYNWNLFNGKGPLLRRQFSNLILKIEKCVHFSIPKNISHFHLFTDGNLSLGISSITPVC